MPYPIPGAVGYMMGLDVVRARRFKATAAGTAGAPAYEMNTAGNGVFEDGSTRVAISAGSSDRAYWSTSGINHNYQTVNISGGIGAVTDITMSGYIQMTEAAAVAAGAANTGRISLVDDAGKTELRVIFNTGAAQQIAQEP